MERSPQHNEHELSERPRLEVDLTTWDGHWFNLICVAQSKLEREALETFNREIGELLWRGKGATYNDLFAAINAHMDLIDLSGAFDAYAPKLKPPDEQAGPHEMVPQASQNEQNQAKEGPQ